ncbi:AAA family ATPase [Nocardia cyriacigeorgica]|uniref:LuxR C-terminal-related transcriptional regulator n=1 Tax=Nocardia cyriacigeorgica TaxID=135487 RepID=UPI0018945BD3|nr:LuxR C-terminal-related transcriptional regulator [Nocardia cyriacigeorgica]MBF6428052.1 AAA family ATPase [Nocardia cyriacigeorgica]
MAGSHDLDSHHQVGPAYGPADIPALPFTPIPRPGLFTALDEFTATAQGRVLMICSPVGSGKTVLLADWARRAHHHARNHSRIAWLTVTEHPYNGNGLWADLRRRLGLAPKAADRLATPTAEAAELAADIARLGGPRIVVLDDAHLITDPMTLAGLEHLLRQAPANLAVLICARFDPPIRWHQLELESRLIRWGADELALSAEEARQLCREHGCDLAEPELAALMELTHGWAALIRIAAIYLAAHPGDYATALAVLARMPNSVSDLLVGELIDTLPPALRQFLTHTSVPTEFTEQLADELAGGGAAFWLHELERMSYPLTAVVRDGTIWYAYHPFLRGYFLAEVNRLGAQVHDELRLRTACALTAAGESRQALVHLAALSDPRHLLDFLATHALPEIIAGGGPALFDALAQSATVVLEDPFILLLRSVDALLGGDYAAALAFRDALRSRTTATTTFAAPDVVAALTGAVDAEIAVATAGSVTDLKLPPAAVSADRPELACYVAIAAGTVAIMRDEIDAGEQRLRVALALAETCAHPRLRLRATTRLAVASGRAGSLTTMRRRAVRALELARADELWQTPDAAHAAALEVFGAYLQGEVPAADLVGALLAESAGMDGLAAPSAGLPAQIVGNLATFDQVADRRGTADHLRNATSELLAVHPAAAVSGGLIPHVVWALLRVQEPRTAQLLVEQARATFGEVAEVVVAAASVAAAAHRPKAVLGLLDPMLTAAEPPHRLPLVAAWLLTAGANHELGNTTKAIQAMEMAVRTAAPDHLVRPFLDIPGALEQLDEFAGSFGTDEDFVAAVRRNCAASREHRHPALTTTQHRILRQLPSGRTTQQIATDLGVSINTVKTHLRGIYAKLGVNSRTEVLTEARRSGLL